MFANLALPLFLVQEPDPVKKTKGKEYDVVAMGPVKAIPEDFTIYDKIVVDTGASLTVDEFIASLKESHKIDVTYIGDEKTVLYNMYAPGQKHEGRRKELLETLFAEHSGEPLVDGRNYLVLTIDGETSDDQSGILVPFIKYVFPRK